MMRLAVALLSALLALAMPSAEIYLEDITPEGDLRSSMSVYSTPQEFAHALEESGALET